MPSTEFQQTVVVPSDHADEVREILQTAVDQIAIRQIPVQASEIEEVCVDKPVEIDSKVSLE